MLKSLIKMWHEYQERAQLRKWCNEILNLLKNKNKKEDTGVYSVLDLLQGCIVKLNSNFMSWSENLTYRSSRRKTGAIETAMINIIELATTVTYLTFMLLGCYTVINYSPIITPELTMKVVMFAYPLCRLHSAMLQRFNYEIMCIDQADNKSSSLLHRVFDALWFISVTASLACYIYIMPGHFVHFMDLALISCFWFDQIKLDNKKDRQLAFFLRVSISVFIMATQPTQSVMHFTTEILPIYGRYFIVGITHFTGPSLHYAAQCAKQIISLTKESYFFALAKPVCRTLFALLGYLFIPLQICAGTIFGILYFISIIPTTLVTVSVKLFCRAITAANAIKTLDYSLLEKILLTNFTVSFYAIAANKVKYGNLFQQVNLQWPLYCIALWCLTPGNGLQYAFLTCAALSGITLLHRFSADISSEIRESLAPTLLQNPDKKALLDRSNMIEETKAHSSVRGTLLLDIMQDFLDQAVSYIRKPYGEYENTSGRCISQQKPLTLETLERGILNLKNEVNDVDTTTSLETLDKIAAQIRNLGTS